MVPPEIVKKIKRMHIKSRRTVSHIMAGQYKSVFKGSGIEFEEVREYSPGDDVKTLDWKVSARLGRPFVKLYTEERESIVMLLIDMSASLNFGTFFGAKLERAAEVAAVLAFNAIKNNDKVGAVFFTDRVEKYIPPKKGSSHVWRVIKEIFTFSPEGRGTDIAAALDYLAKISKKRSFVFVLSDFLDKAYLKSLRTVRRRHEVIGVLIYDQNAFEMPGGCMAWLSDFETGDMMLFDGFKKTSRRAYRKAAEKWHRHALETFARAKSDVIELETGALVSDTLIRYFRAREKRIR